MYYPPHYPYRRQNLQNPPQTQKRRQNKFRNYETTTSSLASTLWVYGQPKIHKLGAPIRPVVSFYNTLLSALHTVLAHYLYWRQNLQNPPQTQKRRQNKFRNYETTTSSLASTLWVYGQPKIHKLGAPIRPVVSFYNTLLSALHTVLAHYLKPLAKIRLIVDT